MMLTSGPVLKLMHDLFPPLNRREPTTVPATPERRRRRDGLTVIDPRGHATAPTSSRFSNTRTQA